MIRLAFGRYRGRMTEIAKRLGIGRSTLYRKMREIGLEARAQLARQRLLHESHTREKSAALSGRYRTALWPMAGRPS